MDQAFITEKLVEWMKSFVEQPNAKLGNWAPCPYARAARIDNKIEIMFCDIDDPLPTIHDGVKSLTNRDVAVIAFDHTLIAVEDLLDFVADVNKVMMPRGYVVLEDHPDAEELVAGVKMNFGFCGLLILQKLDKLNNAADILRNKGYYDNWDQESIDAVVAWRYNNES